MTDQKRAVEAILFAAEGPLPLGRLAEVLGVTDQDALKRSVEELAAEYDPLRMAFGVVEVAGGYQIRTRPEFAHWLRRLKKSQLARLSRAALETLAVVAYKQPVMKSEIDLIRGVETGGVLKSLLEKELIRVVGRKDVPGRPLIYGTTTRFLEVFDLKDLSALPTLEEIKALIEEID
ncbi:MAG: SMC-Scp complex subunit ScpB [Proteobacteria bacterium]|nr:SMC-Scp complex subunit ScpB [Pseudomonadota bacterium]